MSVVRRKKWLAATLATGALMFQALPSGCNEYFATVALSTFDFCSVFNCSGSQFFDLCSPIPLLVDCPQTGEMTEE